MIRADESFSRNRGKYESIYTNNNRNFWTCDRRFGPGICDYDGSAGAAKDGGQERS